MNKPTYFNLLFFVAFAVLTFSCNSPVPEPEATAVQDEQAVPAESGDIYTLKGEHSFLSGYEPVFEDGDINVVVEIPTGTVAKWEVAKPSGEMKWEFVDDKPREVKYLGYPGNYGMIPKTLLPKELGGDGDPLDVIVLGPAVERGSVIKCKLIGVLQLLDRGEQDDKLIAVLENTPFYDVNNLVELDANFNGVSEIVKLWFANYKGPGKMEPKGFADEKKAREILNAAVEAYPKGAAAKE
jgi:inorganic pyrophosphatase